METRNSESCISEPNINFYLPKKKTLTGNCDVCIEDFLEVLKNEAENAKEKQNFLQFPEVSIGHYRVHLGMRKVMDECDRECVGVNVSVYVPRVDLFIEKRLTLKVSGVCGNRSFEKQGELSTMTPSKNLRLSSINAFIENMKHSGNKKLKLQITVDLKEEEREWIITKNRKKKTAAAETVFADMFQDKDFMDFTLESEDGTKFPCHKIVLGTQSSVLKRMFLSPMEEKKESNLRLKYKTDIVEKFVHFFYKREIEAEIEENIDSFLELADMYNMPNLKDQVEEVAISKLTEENMVDMFLLADLYSAEELRTAAEHIIRKNKKKVQENMAEFEKLERNQLMKILSILCE